MSEPSSDARARILLWLGIVAGVALAAIGLVGGDEELLGLPDDAVARVNGQTLSLETFRRLEGAMVAERRGAALEDAQRERVLERLVDEELLFQRGLELGLARHEPTARRAIVSAVVAAVTADAEAEEPDEETLRRFHSETQDRFLRPGRVAVDAVFVSTGLRPEAQAFTRAQDATRRLRAGESVELVASELGDPQAATLPGGLIALETVREYLGPSPAQAVAALEPGATSDPVRGAAGYYVLRLGERAGGEVAPFEEVRDPVRLEWLRAQGERALADVLQDLREDGRVEQRLPPPPATAPAS